MWEFADHGGRQVLRLVRSYEQSGKVAEGWFLTAASGDARDESATAFLSVQASACGAVAAAAAGVV